jgi:hypothetical protein
MRRCADIAGAALGDGAFADGPAIWVGKREIAHFDGPDDLEVRLTRAVIRERRSELRANEGIELRRSTSDWVLVRVRSGPDFDLAYALVEAAIEANLPSAEPGLPPSGPELARRRRFH